ncbi:WRKY domain-containing protein [Artemisia annua]|uniref:WRKY domain-containing protein n=1 Tax=Artemisia annua TaxID=35608 RepID=A0A2U1MZ49_ARTAN|nr:WRKY domain-containing protein [Artemisia annua]
MEFSSWLESLPSNQIEADQELTHCHQWTDTPSEMLCMSQYNEVTLGTSDLQSSQASEVYASNYSIMSDHNVNNVVPHMHINDMYTLKSLDGGKPMNIDDKMVKTVTPSKKKRGCYTRKGSWTSSNVTSCTDDGYEWRKYGQKEIQKSKHKSINYHTCKNFLGPPQIILDSPDDANDTSIIINFESNSLIEKKEVDHHFTPKKHEQHECLSSPPLRDSRSCPFGPVFPVSSGLEHDCEIFTGVSSAINETKQILEDFDFDEIPLDVSFC